MIRRSFGDGERVSVLGIGCSRVASISNPVPMREIEATLEAAVQAGVNLFDTADIYGQGDSERTLARLLRRHRDRMLVVTKVGGHHGRYAGMARFAKRSP
jgi:aryl-alcohol dehydrogenase-like predicted oxidoreductase